MSRIIFIRETDLIVVNRFLFLWKIGEDGEETETDYLTFSFLKVEVMEVKMICRLLIIIMI